MRILVGGVIAMALMAATPQTSNDYYARYGKPDAERFVVRPDLTLSVEYGNDDTVCKMRVEPLHNSMRTSLGDPPAPMDKITEVVDEMVPPETRGKELGPGKSYGTWAGAPLPTEYENVTIIPEYGPAMQGLKPTGIAVLFKRPECESLPKYSDPDWLKPK